MRWLIVLGIILASCGSDKKETHKLTPEELIFSRVGHLLTAPEIGELFVKAEAEDWRGKYNGDTSIFEPIDIVRDKDEVKLESIKPVSLGHYSFEQGYAVFDNRLHDSPVKHQEDRGTCTAFAMVAALENFYWQEHGVDIDLSEEQLWSYYKEGSSSAAFTAVTSHEVVTEELWPYGKTPTSLFDNNRSAVRVRGMSDQGGDLPDMNDVIAAAGKGKPIYMAFAVSRSIYRNFKGLINPSDLGAPDMGHAVAISGLVVDHKVPGNGYFIIKNSWGTTWGDQGYGYIPFKYCDHYACEFRILDGIAVTP